jgi:hypothetical protein
MPKKTLSSAGCPFLILRLWPHHHTSEADLDELMATLFRYRSICDEVWLCTELGFPTLDEHAHSAALMASAAARIRSVGIEPGIQIANTLGHGLSLLTSVDGAEWPLMIDQAGVSEFPTPCPRSASVLRYVESVTKLYTAWLPSSVWIDDDLRMSRHGMLDYGCFCPDCLARFSRKQKHLYDREGLVSALNHPDEGKLRLAWTKFNGQSLAGIARAVARAAKKVSPTTRLGFQQIGHEEFLSSGPDWSPTLNTLAQLSQQAVGARLGHGFYIDHSPRGMIDKAFVIARQVGLLPDSVSQIAAEIDSYSHNAFGKSAQGIAVEATLDLAMGCNSLSFAIFCSGHEPMRWYDDLLARLAAWRPFWDAYAGLNAGSKPSGFRVCLGPRHVSRSLRDDEPPFGWTTIDLSTAYALAPLGLPLCATPDSANPVLLHSEAVDGFSVAELKRIFAGGVLLDGQAAWRLQERGLGDLLGMAVTRLSAPISCREWIPDPVQVGQGRSWNSWGNPSGAYQLTWRTGSVVPVGLYHDRFNAERGVATALSENHIGGRVAVFGYFGWEAAPSGAKRDQYLAAADWVSDSRLPVIVRTWAQVVVVPRVDSQGRLVSVLLLNASIDSTPELDIVLRGIDVEQVGWMVPEHEDIFLRLVTVDQGKACRTPVLLPWSVAVLVVRPK